MVKENKKEVKTKEVKKEKPVINMYHEGPYKVSSLVAGRYKSYMDNTHDRVSVIHDDKSIKNFLTVMTNGLAYTYGEGQESGLGELLLPVFPKIPDLPENIQDMFNRITSDDPKVDYTLTEKYSIYQYFTKLLSGLFYLNHLHSSVVNGLIFKSIQDFSLSNLLSQYVGKYMKENSSIPNLTTSNFILDLDCYKDISGRVLAYYTLERLKELRSCIKSEEENFITFVFRPFFKEDEENRGYIFNKLMITGYTGNDDDYITSIILSFRKNSDTMFEIPGRNDQSEIILN